MQPAAWKPHRRVKARTRRLNDELHAFVRQRNLKACLAALARGERDKNVDGRSYATACCLRPPGRRDRGVPRCRGAITPSTRVVSGKVKWVVSFSILGPFGPSRETTMLHTGATALRLLRTAGERGGKCSPGVEACTAAVKALGSNDVDAAFSLMEAMSRAGTSHAPHECGPLTEIAKPNQRTLNLTAPV